MVPPPRTTKLHFKALIKNGSPSTFCITKLNDEKEILRFRGKEFRDVFLDRNNNCKLCQKNMGNFRDFLNHMANRHELKILSNVEVLNLMREQKGS